MIIGYEIPGLRQLRVRRFQENLLLLNAVGNPEQEQTALRAVVNAAPTGCKDLALAIGYGLLEKERRRIARERVNRFAAILAEGNHE